MSMLARINQCEFPDFMDLWVMNREYFTDEGRETVDVVYDSEGWIADYTVRFVPCPQPTDFGITLMTCWDWLVELADTAYYVVTGR